MTVSIWERVTSPGPRRGTADLVVIGGGVVGVSTALRAQERGMRTIVLERGRIASGASGRNAGFLIRGAADSYSAAAEDLGREVARRAWRLCEENLESLVSLRAGDLPSFRRMPSCVVATGEDELELLRWSLEMLREDGFETGWLDGGDDSLWKSGIAKGGLVNPDDAAVSPVELVRHLAGLLEAPVVEHSEVVRVAEEGGRAVVETAAGVYEAERVMLCTNAFGPLLLPELAEHIAPKRGQMLAVRGPGLRLDCSYYANFGDEYFRQLPDGTIVVGGFRADFANSEVGYEDRTTGPVQARLERFARRLLGDNFEVVARWAGTMGFTPDHLPIVGPVRTEQGGEGRIWHCGGFSGHGMSMGHRTAQLAVDAMLDGTEPPYPISRFAARARR